MAVENTVNNDPCGILVVDKEKGMTSHDVVALVRRKFGIKKVGHAGTLDPNATGVLVILLGKATKMQDGYLSEDKEYMAEMKLGEKTSSGDRDGETVSVREVGVSEDEIRKVMSGFIGEREQVPPMVSARKVNGRRLYKLARKGLEVKRTPKRIWIREVEIIKVDLPYVVFRTVCSKGTYVRQLAEDMGEKMRCGAHLTELKRLRSGSFSLDKAVAVGAIRGMDRKALDENIIRIQRPQG